MTKVERYAKPKTVEEALAARLADPSAAYLAGGTLLMAGDARDKPSSVIDLGSALGRGISRSGGSLEIGALATFQELAESAQAPAFLAEAALTMANRNARNRGTIGGNLAADKSCSSIIPLLVALEAEVETASPLSPAPRRRLLEAWLKSRAEAFEAERAADLVLSVSIPLDPATRAAYRRWNRSACDLSVLGAAVAYSMEGGAIRGLRIALGGLGPKARRFPVLEALFEGKALPSREEVEAAAAPLLKPIDDLRASAAFKRLRGAQLLADAISEARA
jgi:probable selenate reductase FAD-binding subunit